jgi:hypothetical protein
MLRASLGKVVHTVKRAGTYAAKVPSQELHKIAVHVRAVGQTRRADRGSTFWNTREIGLPSYSKGLSTVQIIERKFARRTPDNLYGVTSSSVLSRQHYCMSNRGDSKI